MSQPIDYARGDSTDVVRKKFRRRVVWFVVVTVVVMVIGVGWRQSHKKWFTTRALNMPSSVETFRGTIIVYGSPRKATLVGSAHFWKKVYENRAIGIGFSHCNQIGFARWAVEVRYRTLFILAMIPWIITLIRLIRIRQRIHPETKEPRTQ